MSAMTRISYVETFQFQPVRELSECQCLSDVVLIPCGRLFHANTPATEKIRWLKPAVLVRGTTRSPWPAERKCRLVETAESGIDHRHEVRGGELVKTLVGSIPISSAPPIGA